MGCCFKRVFELIHNKDTNSLCNIYIKCYEFYGFMMEGKKKSEYSDKCYGQAVQIWSMNNETTSPG